MVERAAVNRDVVGSSPTSGAIFSWFEAQWVVQREDWPLSVKRVRSQLRDKIRQDSLKLAHLFIP